LYDALIFKGQGNFKHIDLQLGFTEYKVYYIAMLVSNSQSKFDCLRQLHTLDMIDDNKERFWECIEVLKYCEENGVDGNTNYNYLVEWNDMNTSQLWANFFVLSLSNPSPIISFAGKNTIWIRFPSVISYNTASLNH
jgi:hypothetical protein